MSYTAPVKERSLLGLAAAGGAVSFVSTILHTPAFNNSILPSQQNGISAFSVGIVVGTILAGIAFAMYAYGFAVLGKLMGAPLLRYASCVQAALTILATAVIAVLYIPGVPSNVFGTLSTVLSIADTLCVLTIGYAILQHQKHFGEVGKWYGLLELLAATGVLYAISDTAVYALTAILYVLGIALLWQEAKKL
jgi:hypothetical protein